MPVILTLFMVTLAFAQTRSPQKHYSLIGGGGERHREPVTIFDHEVQGYGEFMGRSRGAWQTRVAFNGGHSGTEAMVDRLFGESPNFSDTEYEKMLDHYKEQLTSRRIGRGDQLLIHIASHGAEKAPGEKTHRISSNGAMTNMTTGAGSTLVNLDKLQEIRDLANANGVKLAIIDTSCHSGNSLALANSQTCVISSSGPNHFASGHYIGFGARFSRELQSGRNLEDIFLRTVSQRPMPTSLGNQIPPVFGFPMISSPGGQTLQDEIYPLLTPYLYNNEGPRTADLDKLDPFMRRSIQEDPTCQAPTQNFQNLIRQIQELGESSRRLRVQPLITAIQNYETLQRELREGLAAIETPDLERTEEFCRPMPAGYRPGNHCMTVKLSDLIRMDYNSVIASQRNQVASRTGLERAYAQMQLELFTSLQARIDQLKNDPSIRRSREYFRSMSDLPGRTSRMVQAIYTELHKIYPTIYREEQERKRAEPNPCRDFVL